MGKKLKFLEVSEQLQELLDADMDNVSARRSAREAFKQVQLSIDHCLFKVCFDLFFFIFDYVIQVLNSLNLFVFC